MSGRVLRTEVDKVATGSYFKSMAVQGTEVVGVKLLKNRLSAYLRRVREGEVFLVTDRNRVVAELRPPEPGRALEVSDAILAAEVREGLIRPALRAPSAPPTRIPLAPLKTLLDELASDRGDR